MTTPSSNTTPKPKAREGMSNHEDQAFRAASEELFETVQAGVVEAKDALVERAESLSTAVANFIKARPIVSLLGAFGLGYVVMRLVRRA